MSFQKYKIKDLGEVVTGHTPPTKERKYYGDFCPLIKPTDMDINCRYIGHTMEGLSKLGYEKFKKKLVPKNTPCVVTIGTIGKHCLTKEISLCNQAVNSIIVNPKKHNPFFVFYLMKMTIPVVKNLSSGTASGRENVSKSVFESIEVKVPPLPTQLKIATILSAYDDLIENNTKRIKILEEIAQNLYTEWFVKFKFPGHENINMVESELGRVPNGWKTVTLKEVLQNIKDNVKAGTHLYKTPYLPIDCLARKSLSIIESKPGIEAKSSLVAFKENDILFGAMRPYFHKVVIAPFEGITRSTCFVLRPIEEYAYSWAVMTMFEEKTVQYANQHSRGATIPYAVWNESLADMPCICPPTLLLKQFEKLVRPMLETIKLSYFRRKNLQHTRDLLLPKLISGEIDVSELDIDVGGITV